MNNKLKDFLVKLGDTTFLTTLIPIIVGVLSLFNTQKELINLVTSLVLIVVPCITYVCTTKVLEWSKISLALKQIIEIVDSYSEETRAGSAPDDTDRITDDLLKKIIAVLKTAKLR